MNRTVILAGVALIIAIAAVGGLAFVLGMGGTNGSGDAAGDKGPGVNNGLTPTAQPDTSLEAVAQADLPPDALSVSSIPHSTSLEELPWRKDGLNDWEKGVVQSLDEIERASPAAARSLATLAWMADEVTPEEGLALHEIRGIAESDASLSRTVIAMSWLTDDVTEEEYTALSQINDIAKIDHALAQSVLDLPMLAEEPDDMTEFTLSVVSDSSSDEDSSLVWRIVESQEIADGITTEELASLTGYPNYFLSRLEKEYPDIAAVVKNYAWALGPTSSRSVTLSAGTGVLASPLLQESSGQTELRALSYIRGIAEIDSDLARGISELPWVADGIDQYEIYLIRVLFRMVERDLNLAQRVYELPWLTDETSIREIIAIVTLNWLWFLDDNLVETMYGQGWFQDGISRDDWALALVLKSACFYGKDCGRLIENGQVYSEPFELGSQELGLTIVSLGDMEASNLAFFFGKMRTGIEISSELMGSQWPSEDVVALWDPNSDLGYPVAGLFGFTHIYVSGQPSEAHTVVVLLHELGHYYFHLFPKWWSEGGASFIESYAQQEINGVALQTSSNELRSRIERYCAPFGRSDIHQRLLEAGPDANLCDYYLGERFLLGMYLGLGHEAVSAAVRELYEFPMAGRYRSEEAIYRVFLSNVPQDQHQHFHDLYEELHGRPPGYSSGDRMVLETLFNENWGLHWERKNYWLRKEVYIGLWEGVTVDDNGRVIRLDLANNVLGGRLLPELGRLTQLQHLDLRGNSFGGEIPPEFGELAYLETLYLWGRLQYTGCIPESLKDIPNNDFDRLNIPPCWEIPLPTPTPVPTTTPMPTPALEPTPIPTPTAIPSPEEYNAATDKAALIALYHATGGPNWVNNTNWLTDAPLSQWHGVYLDASGRVQVLDLHENGLTGQLPAELGHLSQLVHLILYTNQLAGELPEELAQLSNLTNLSVGLNRMSGPIPGWLGDISNLEILHLPENLFTGQIPRELTRLSRLTRLGLYGNQLTGCIPAGLLQVANNDLNYLVQELGLTSCDLPPSGDPALEREALVALYQATGGPSWENSANWLTNAPVGEWYGVTATGDGLVTALNLPENGLRGQIPPEIGILRNLVSLNLGHNRFTGTIPAQMGSLVGLRVLGLTNAGREGGLSGPIPPELGNLARLRTLYLGGHDLSGELPSSLANLTELEQLVLWENRLRGPIPPWLGSLTKLHRLELWSNQFSGPIPSELGNLMEMGRLQISDNLLSEPVPAELGNLKELDRVGLSGNQLTGCLPTNWKNVEHNDFLGTGLPFCDSIPGPSEPPTPLPIAEHERDRIILDQFFRISNGFVWKNNENWLSDEPIGRWYGVSTNANGRVTAITLPNNNLSGILFGVLGELPELTTVRLQSNQLVGRLSEHWGKASKLRELNVSGNLLGDSISAEIGNLTNLEILAIGENEISGPIPPELGNLAKLKILEASGNQLTGSIPPELGKLSQLTALGLSNNQLTGTIPTELGGLSELEYLNLRFNQLDGNVPSHLGNLRNLTGLFLIGNDFSGCLPSHWKDVEDSDFHNMTMPFCDQ